MRRTIATVMTGALLVLSTLVAPSASARAGGVDDYTVHDVKVSNIKAGGTLITVRVVYSCPHGDNVLVQASLTAVRFLQNGVVSTASFGALDESAVCTGHRQKSNLALPVPEAFPGAKFLATQNVRSFGFVQEFPNYPSPVDAIVHQAGPFIQDIR